MFTEKDIWRYLALYKIPVNPLYKKGYRSLGCKPCSHKEKSECEGDVTDEDIEVEIYLIIS